MSEVAVKPGHRKEGVLEEQEESNQTTTKRLIKPLARMTTVQLHVYNKAIKAC